jgi:Arc/MetJ-type ribon-helix-helix transcriptional regulator
MDSSGRRRLGVCAENYPPAHPELAANPCRVASCRVRARSRRFTPCLVSILAAGRYHIGMKRNTKSSITLPAEEVRMVEALQVRLGAKSKVEVVRRGLKLLRDSTDREALRRAFSEASKATRQATLAELEELDVLTPEGLD